MAGYSNNLCYILLFCASLVSAGDKVNPSDQAKTVPVTQGNINSNAVALCKYYVSSHYNSLVQGYWVHTHQCEFLGYSCLFNCVSIS